MTFARNTIKTVLVIDDEAATLTMFRLFLNAYGYTAMTAENGAAGLQLLGKHHPDIVFTDIKMPGMNGFEVLKTIKREAPATEVIVITGHGDMDHAVRALNLEATDFITKPIRRSALDAALKRAEARLLNDQRGIVPVQMDISSDVAILVIRGTLSGAHKALLMALMDQASAADAKGIVLRFDEHAAVNGTGIALLTRLIAEARSDGTRFCITGLSENFKTIFNMVGVTRLAPYMDTLEAAVKAVSQNARS
ncbi:response regulator [Desulfosarcina sp.]|uniref:response regulator n=1 Tax=Desulfosarcina sp. TaxID=2027861 RepID=UPI0039705544